ncbi:MAG: hypothetical protein RL150_669 [Candidatus Parcubacteria bacterium]|jgi:uncharacterized membrane protein YdbT with pleckstrin-like domain
MSISFDQGEVVLFEVRKHWFVLVAELGFCVLGTLLPMVLYAVVSVLPLTFSTPGNGLLLFAVCYTFWVLALIVVMAYLWTDYYLDVWVVTNQRVIDIEQRGLFSREVATMQLSKIQDIATDVRGFIATMIGFGDVRIQTAGNEREFVIRGVAYPDKVRAQVEAALESHGAIAIKLNTAGQAAVPPGEPLV